MSGSKAQPLQGRAMKRKKTSSFSLLFGIIFISIPVFSQTPISYNELKNRVAGELRHFTEITGMASQFKPLSGASPLGIWGGNFGVELTSIPQDGFRILGQPIKTPLFFPRLHLAKGLTPNLDMELSALVSKVIESAVDLPEEAKNLQIYGGGLKYSILTDDSYPFSLAARATYTYTRFNLGLFLSDTYGADISVSRSLALSAFPLSFTPYAGMGYVVINGMFRKDFLDLTKTDHSYLVQEYRYFTGMSMRLFLLNVTGEADFGNPSEANTYSLKVGLNIF
ncbi:MAG: hypothetical protein A2Z91_08165 [Deltaproteobacteria bacterium GWA2_38_16]|nr:MAG: hypothetical protein A2Z91_08165 [Deltaproteobacteria bacterium GWA2_38_16]OGQ01881.1 MAG: hypothetical protein A3D19_03175 [Deltaproteobacteria bacterium RIFCSPHIGHO2_02_FULL_38_15]OGQ29940.1 MAG: hypothetical protein A3A72_05845 [Deltaproteobacteria bacterium RIFCSPLOWO2_01_FULL_38_9]OGQ60019.1 MAG: hypothetical protein A3G92_04370 [Deltaproteobacteria bacterium RIFCSPLOWO2_12_FULL_38_8]HBQ20763.1 hypothetical protein [Deltaproteobacteria bacterium]